MTHDMLYGPGDVILERYELARILGSGGWGRVYLANDQMLHRLVAVKQLLPRLAADPSAVGRFKREASVVASIRDPHVLTIHDIAERDGQHYMVMEYADAGTLAQVLQLEGILSPYEALSVAIDVCKGLRAVHSKGVVHRDLKPANVMFFSGPDGLPIAKLGDFGIALRQQEDRLTPSDNVMGTLIYLSPEQASSFGVITHASDLYSLGVMLYEMMTGELEEPLFANSMFNNSDSNELLLKLGVFPEPVRPLIIKALKRKTEDRFQSADEMLQALERSRNRLTVSFATQAFEQVVAPVAVTPAPKAKVSSRLLATIGVILAVLAGAAITVLLMRSGTGEATRVAASASSLNTPTPSPVVSPATGQPTIVPTTPSPTSTSTPSSVSSPTPSPLPSTVVAADVPGRVTGPATLKVLFRDSASMPNGVFEVDDKSAPSSIIYLEGSYLWGEVATRIGDTLFQIDRGDFDLKDPSQALPPYLKLDLEYSAALVAAMQDVVTDPPGFDAKTGEFWVGRFQCGSASTIENSPYWISVRLLRDGREILSRRYMIGVLSNLKCAEGEDEGGGPPSRRD